MKFLILAVFLAGCSIPNNLTNRIRIISIKTDSVQNIAIPETAINFFKRRMQNNKVEKAVGIRCEILFENDSLIFYGYLFRDDISDYVKKIYSVNKKNIEILFPKFREIEGFDVKQKVYDNTINLEIQRAQNLKYQITYQINIENDLLIIFVDYKYRKDFLAGGKKKYKVELSRNDLSIIKIVSL